VLEDAPDQPPIGPWGRRRLSTRADIENREGIHARLARDSRPRDLSARYLRAPHLTEEIRAHGAVVSDWVACALQAIHVLFRNAKRASANATGPLIVGVNRRYSGIHRHYKPKADADSEKSPPVTVWKLFLNVSRWSHFRSLLPSIEERRLWGPDVQDKNVRICGVQDRGRSNHPDDRLALLNSFTGRGSRCAMAAASMRRIAVSLPSKSAVVTEHPQPDLARRVGE
jgi:hypothetical protein